MPLTTVSLPSGVPTGAGTEADPFVWTGRVAETFSNAVYAKAFDNYLLSRVTRLPAASAFNLRRITAYEAGAGAAEGATTTETQISGAVERSLLTTYRAQQTSAQNSSRTVMRCRSWAIFSRLNLPRRYPRRARTLSRRHHGMLLLPLEQAHTGTM